MHESVWLKTVIAMIKTTSAVKKTCWKLGYNLTAPIVFTTYNIQKHVVVLDSVEAPPQIMFLILCPCQSYWRRWRTFTAARSQLIYAANAGSTLQQKLLIFIHWYDGSGYWVSASLSTTAVCGFNMEWKQVDGKNCCFLQIKHVTHAAVLCKLDETYIKRICLSERGRRSPARSLGLPSC